MFKLIIIASVSFVDASGNTNGVSDVDAVATIKTNEYEDAQDNYESAVELTIQAIADSVAAQNQSITSQGQANEANSDQEDADAIADNSGDGSSGTEPPTLQELVDGMGRTEQQLKEELIDQKLNEDTTGTLTRENITGNT